MVAPQQRTKQQARDACMSFARHQNKGKCIIHDRTYRHRSHYFCAVWILDTPPPQGKRPAARRTFIRIPVKVTDGGPRYE